MWKFNRPSASCMGSALESNIKMTKKTSKLTLLELTPKNGLRRLKNSSATADKLFEYA